ncbi:MAG TPA: mechanosensitive ion channel, partial [Alphaproteobacteria bacterium]|nr:mechanosensitive ion channel [Alphaproteobacteria bacterium]
RGLGEQIEAVRREIATRLAALGEEAVADPEIVSLRRLADVLQRAQEAQRVSVQLEAGQEEASQRAARPPSAYFKAEPPYAVPLLDAVFLSWEAQRTQLDRLSTVVSDTQAALQSAREELEQAERRRRRAREEWERADEGPEKARLAAALRQREAESRIALAKQELARIALRNAELEHAMQRAAERQAAAALEWVRVHLLPDDDDLQDVLAELEKRSFDVERALEATRLDLADAAERLEAARERTAAAAPDEAAVRAAEVAARRLAFTAAQRRVALLGERAQRLDLAREAWQRRYRVLAGEVDAEASRRWRDEAERHADDLRRQQRIKQARVAELQGDLEQLRDRLLATPAGSDRPVAGETREPEARRELTRWLRAQESDSVALLQLYQEDLANVSEVLRLESRLVDELVAHDAGLALQERIARLWTTAAEIWSYEITASEDRSITVGKVVTALVVFTIGLLLARRLAAWLSGRVLSRFGYDTGVRSAFESLFFYAAVAATFLFALRTVNIPLTAFAVLGGALALGIGFGSQTVVSNFISGLILLAERPIKPGDHIEVEGIYGVVERIGLRSTRIRTGDNFHIIVPNASFLERSVINWTHDTNVVRLKIPVGVAYGSDIRTVERVLVEVARDHPSTLESPAPLVLFRDFADSALLFEVRFWIMVRDIGDKLGIESQVRFAIDDRFREEGVVIAFPQRDLHIDASRPLPVRIEREGGT